MIDYDDNILERIKAGYGLEPLNNRKKYKWKNKEIDIKLELSAIWLAIGKINERLSLQKDNDGVKHAYWYLGSPYSRCSNCGFSFPDVGDLDNADNYCRHCGAKMDGQAVD